MTEQPDNIEPLIQEIKARTEAEKEKAGTVALLNLIPYVGGAVASVIGDIYTRRKLEKICDVLCDLNSKLQSHGVDPERHLSKDQIIEVVYETLQTVTTASDEQKIAALKNGLAYVFLSGDSFERKQLFLQVLRACTSLELTVLAALYGAGDPYIVRESPPFPLVDPTALLSDSFSVATSALYADRQQGYWRPVGNKSDCGQPSPLKFLAERVRSDEATTEGAARLLDGKGLASAGPNLHRNDCKLVAWDPTPGGTYLGHLTVLDSLPITTTVNPTPLEASRTKFGEDFQRFGGSC